MRKTLLAKAAFTLLAAFFGFTGVSAQTIVSDVQATHIDESSAHLSWTGNATSLRYRVAGDSTVYNFDNSTLSPWTTYTAWTQNNPRSQYSSASGNYYGTKFMWAIYSTDKTYHSYAAGTGLGRNGSTDMVISGSYCGDGTSAAGVFSDHGIEPDNYLVSPQITLGGTISFWAKGMDPAACEEKFGVFYTTNYNSTTPRNTSWTLVGSAQTTTSEWTQYIFDLGGLSVAGQNGRIAIRHWDCYDQDMLCVDDIILTAPGGNWTTVTIPSGTSYDLTGLDMLTNYQVEVQVGSTWKGTGFSTTTTNPIPSEVDADPDAVGATISWWGKGSGYEVWYKSEPYDGPQYFFDDFEDDSKWSKWTVVEGSNSNSPYPWERQTVPTDQLKFTDHSGTKSVGSFSWHSKNGYQSDCYLITPKVLIGNKVKFWVRCNPGYPDEFEVVLSTSGNSIADFTGENSATRHILRALAPAPAADEWRRISLDVPDDFVDKQGYIAIHHNHYDGNYLFIDDFGIFEPDIPGSGVWTKLETTADHIEIGKLIPNTPYDYYIVSNKNGVVAPTPASVRTDEFHFTTLKLAELVLEDNGQNSPEITALGGGTVQTLTLKDRTLKANTWNTLCLPVNVELTPVDGGGYNWTGTSTKVDVRQLTDATYNEATQTLTLTFSAANEISILKAGVPYIIKPNDNISGKYLTLTERIIKAGMEPVTITIVEGDEENEEVNLMFRGTYDKVAFESENRSVLFVKSNKLVFPVAGSYVNAQRALFYFKGAHVGNAIGNLVKELVVDLDDEDPTGIEELFGIETAGTWYDLNGRKLNGKPTQKGIYINNGKKTIIK